MELAIDSVHRGKVVRGKAPRFARGPLVPRRVIARFRWQITGIFTLQDDRAP